MIQLKVINLEACEEPLCVKPAEVEVIFNQNTIGKYCWLCGLERKNRIETYEKHEAYIKRQRRKQEQERKANK